MNRFAFCGELPASKSLYIRWLLIQDYAPWLKLLGESMAEDVLAMKAALADLHAGREVFCGAAGTVFRFMCLRAARTPGKHVLFGTERLMRRPHDDVFQIFSQLQVTAHWQELGSARKLVIHTEGFRPADKNIEISSPITSQFASALLLNSWQLPFDLRLSWGEPFASYGYFLLSQELAKQAGMTLQSSRAGELVIPAGSEVTVRQAQLEPDLSSAFVIAAIAAVAGQAEIIDFPAGSSQPDFAFVEILKRMGVQLAISPQGLSVWYSAHLRAIEVDLSSCPDLFPVLAVLCSACEGSSRLFGAPHLQHKESRRIDKVSELLHLLGASHIVHKDGLEIAGCQAPKAMSLVRRFDPDQDHRLAMAAQLAIWLGAALEIENREVVNKSFPGFWALAGLRP